MSRKIATDRVSEVLKHWREDGKLYVTPPSSRDVEVAQRVVYLVENILFGEDYHYEFAVSFSGGPYKEPTVPDEE